MPMARRMKILIIWMAMFTVAMFTVASVRADEVDAIQARAEAEGMSVSHWIRRRLLGRSA